jgi:hypothetical protein
MIDGRKREKKGMREKVSLSGYLSMSYVKLSLTSWLSVKRKRQAH